MVPYLLNPRQLITFQNRLTYIEQSLINKDSIDNNENKHNAFDIFGNPQHYPNLELNFNNNHFSFGDLICLGNLSYYEKFIN